MKFELSDMKASLLSSISLLTLNYDMMDKFLSLLIALLTVAWFVVRFVDYFKNRNGRGSNE